MGKIVIIQGPSGCGKTTLCMKELGLTCPACSMEEVVNRQGMMWVDRPDDLTEKRIAMASIHSEPCRIVVCAKTENNLEPIQKSIQLFGAYAFCLMLMTYFQYQILLQTFLPNGDALESYRPRDPDGEKDALVRIRGHLGLR